MKSSSSRLFNTGFVGLMVAQFFGAMNDNILKVVLTFMVIDGAWSGDLGSGGQGIVGICFTVPFMILSGFAGQVADRHSKRTVTLWVKAVEIPIAALAGIGFYYQNLWITMIALTLLTCQSSFFGPAKYGMIPELVRTKHLSRANGAINMLTNVAVILGTIIAGKTSELYAPSDTAAALPWLPGVILVVTAIIGLAASFMISPLPVGDRNLKYKLNPFTTYIETIREMSKSRLLMVMLAWGYFYLLAGLALFIVPEYTLVLDINHTEASVLMGVLGVAIGLGCAVAGFISGDSIKPQLTTIGAAGLVVFFFLLAAVPPWMPDTRPLLRVALSNVSFFILCAGFFAGFYIIPLQALLQQLSPDDERGQFLGTANAVSFAFMTVAGVMYAVIRPSFGLEPQNIFYVCSGLMLAGAAFFLWKLRGTGILVGSRAATSPDSPTET
ncbi:MFS transporter [Stieleria sp. TO1_6]|uniref:MFS transporter n=1 Tax=Stieleria tagensis TaxID=2956795 RepID=UPI00209A91F7|nr:MFS transporter [Stieleria tagensis]MCO8120194.1 MFS transporter [Stieleria tagensis]